jgi:hypothetical protein
MFSTERPVAASRIHGGLPSTPPIIHAAPLPAAAPTTVQGAPIIGLPGRAATDLRHRPANVPPSERPDIAMSEMDGDSWRLMAASTRGVQHSLRGEPRQDSFGVAVVDDVLYCVVCDGVGEFKRSHVAADFVVNSVLQAVMDHASPAEALVLANDGLTHLDVDGEGRLATTVMVAAMRGGDNGWSTLQLWWIGDPYAWVLQNNMWTCLNMTPSDSGDVFSTATQALPTTRFCANEMSVSVRADAVFFMTDGVGQPMITIPEVREALANWWTVKPHVFDFARQVSFARQTHMDDRTVVGVWPSQAPSEMDRG